MISACEALQATQGVHFLDLSQATCSQPSLIMEACMNKQTNAQASDCMNKQMKHEQMTDCMND